MKRKKLPSKKHKGFYVYCSKCRKYYSWTTKNIKKDDGGVKRIEPKCGNSEKLFSSCKFFEKHKYMIRLHIPGSNDKKLAKTLLSLNYNDAVNEAIQYENELRTNNFSVTNKNTTSNDSTKSTNRISTTEIASQINTIVLFEAQIKYLDFLENVDVPIHQQVQRSKRHIKEIQKSLLLFNEALEKENINKKKIDIAQVQDLHVGHFHSYLLDDKGYKNKTYNNKMGALRSFFKWALDKYNLNTKNPFGLVRNRSVAIIKDTITKKEFADLLAMISPERGIETKNKQVRNRYKPYLKDGIELALHTGGRREEVVELKWNMIKEIENQPTFIAVPNYKIKRQLGEGFNDNVAPKIIPVTKSLLKLLYRLGYEKKKNSQQYILIPDRVGISTYAIMDNLSKGFSHFYRQLNTGRELQLKNLRKTYLTYLNAALSGDTKKLSSHATDDVLLKHYIDEKIINKAVKDLEFY